MKPRALKSASRTWPAWSTKPGDSPRSGWTWLLLIALLAIAWHQTLVEMWLRWFPAWNRPALSLVERLTEGDSYYAHGPLVPLLSVAVALLARRRSRPPTSRGRSATLTGWLILVPALAIHVLSVYAGVMFVSGFALIGVLVGLLLCTGGWPLLRTYGPAVGLLIFMVPLPMAWIADLNLALKLRAGGAAVWLTGHLLGVPAIIDGSCLLLPAGNAGSIKTLILGNVCSGLRSLIALTWFGALFAVLCRLGRRWRVAIVVLALPVAIGCNVLRIVLLLAAVDRWDPSVARPGAWLHDVSGLVVFLLAMAIFLAGERMILRWRTWPSPPSRRAREVTPHTPWPRPRFACLATIALAAMLSLTWANRATATNKTGFAAAAAADELYLNGHRFVGRDLDVGPFLPIVLETDDCLYRRYTSSRSTDTLDLLIVFSPDNRKGTHPPEVCLEALGWNLTDKTIRALDVPQRGTISTCELVSQRNDRRCCHVYVYKAGDRYTPYFFTQQAMVFFNGLARRNTSGALIRISVPVNGRDVDAALNLARTGLADLLPRIDEVLP